MCRILHKLKLIFYFCLNSYRPPIPGGNTGDERLLCILRALVEQNDSVDDIFVARELGLTLRIWKIKQGRLVALGLLTWKNQVVTGHG